MYASRPGQIINGCPSVFSGDEDLFRGDLCQYVDCSPATTTNNSFAMADSRLEIAPLPAQDITIADAIKASCKECLERYGININKSACEDFLLKLDRDEYEKRVEAEPVHLRFPLQFSSQLDELNVVAMVCLLEGFHSYEDLLKEKTGRGVWETMRYLVLAAYLSPESQSTSILTTRGLVEATPEYISTVLSLPLHIERPIAENSPISLAEPDRAVARFVEDLLEVLHSTGKVLQQSGLPNLASFLATRTTLNEDEMIRQLTGAFSTFRDMYTLDGKCAFNEYFRIWLLTLVETIIPQCRFRS
ncbi:hypothetical protein, variant [Puccinia triticina 1-1 BBBD Race 1]|uniref:Queuosine 5'-phosphate N-glycosylase/hydrolase n=1 Tax=Puccinia triticina (isolate 1-1 / race 1 (BBBD)) TaxID=630390 RepID=A0A180G9P3_PUCT1|nr:hypothetical protein, variant [Puccinia triticina 1-1 BBBD Race 1]